MFKRAALEATPLDSACLARLEATRRRALALDPSSQEAYDAFNQLCVNLHLRGSRGSVMFDGCEQTVYCGRSGDTLVFAIYIGDDEPTWLTEFIDLSEEEIPVHGESVYVTMQANSRDVQLAVYSGDSATWNCEALPPLGDDDLALLIDLVNA